MKGFSLIEVVISLFILSIALSAFLLLQTKILKRIYSSYLYTVAVTQVNSAFSRSLSLNRNELFVWNLNNKILLPQGKGEFGSLYDISLCWFDRLSGDKKCLKFQTGK